MGLSELCADRVFAVLRAGGSDAAEMCSSRDRPRPGAHPLRAGAGASPVLHDPEGPDQHGSAADQMAAAARVTAQRESFCLTGMSENENHEITSRQSREFKGKMF